jgi:hypothetical protein
MALRAGASNHPPLDAFDQKSTIVSFLRCSRRPYVGRVFKLALKGTAIGAGVGHPAWPTN